jgi:pimeloyl-ACP methyl ester carboxylesterase
MCAAAPTEYLHQNYASDLATMLETLGVARTSLIGTSMGGIISMMYAGGWPNRVERLLLNDIGPEINEAGAARIGNYVGTAPERFKDLDEVVAHFKQNYPAMARLASEVAREFVKWSVKPAPASGLMWKMDPNVRRPVRGTQQRFDFWVPYARITCPILIVRGGESDILAPDTTARMCKVQNLATVVEIPGVAHAPMLTEPASLAAIKEFFKLQ